LISQSFRKARLIIDLLKLKRVILAAPRFVGCITVSGRRKDMSEPSIKDSSSASSSSIVIQNKEFHKCFHFESITSGLQMERSRLEF